MKEGGSEKRGKGVGVGGGGGDFVQEVGHEIDHISSVVTWSVVVTREVGGLS